VRIFEGTSPAAEWSFWSKTRTRLRLIGAWALRSKGYKVVEARIGEAAFEILRGAVFDFLITGMVMLKVGGAEMIKAACVCGGDYGSFVYPGYT